MTDTLDDLIIVCRKCGHNIYITNWNSKEKLEKIIGEDCPACGEEGYQNWILSGFGNYEKEYGRKSINVEDAGDIDISKPCVCGGSFVHYMDVEVPNQKGTTCVYECNKCHKAFER